MDLCAAAASSNAFGYADPGKGFYDTVSLKVGAWWAMSCLIETQLQSSSLLLLHPCPLCITVTGSPH